MEDKSKISINLDAKDTVRVEWNKNDHKFNTITLDKVATFSGNTGPGGSIKHNHRYRVNAKGDGNTTSTSTGPQHTHAISKYKVQPAGEDKHTHRIAIRAIGKQ